MAVTASHKSDNEIIPGYYGMFFGQGFVFSLSLVCILTCVIIGGPNEIRKKGKKNGIFLKMMEIVAEELLLFNEQ